MSFTFESLIPFVPEIILVIAALTVMIIGLFMETSSKKLLGYFSIVALLASIAVIIAKGIYEVELTGFLAGSLTIDPMSQFFKLTFLLVSLLVVIASIKEFEEHSNQDEYYTLVLLGTVGMMLVASAVDIVTMFIGFELASLSTYVLAGFNKNEPKNIEAAIKYF